ncbi:hypothetical protein Tco_1036770 [Tanacetum coccineum]
MQLDLEEKMAARPKIDEYHHRMSCVNSSDILRSARNALNQYPRFSLDGKDAMYRSSFRNFDRVTSGIRNRRSVETSGGWCLPAKVAGERVIRCKPGVVGKLIGLEGKPIPIRTKAPGRTLLFSGNKTSEYRQRDRIRSRKVESKLFKSAMDTVWAENPACEGFFIDIFGGGLGSSWSSVILGDEDNLVVEAGRVNEVPKRDPENCKGGMLVSSKWTAD